MCNCTYQHILQFPSSRSPKTVSFSCLFCRVSSGLLGTEWPSDSPQQLPQLRQQLPLAAQRFTKCKTLALPCCTVWKQFHCIGEQCCALLNTLSYNLCNNDSQGWGCWGHRRGMMVTEVVQYNKKALWYSPCMVSSWMFQMNFAGMQSFNYTLTLCRQHKKLRTKKIIYLPSASFYLKFEILQLLQNLQILVFAALVISSWQLKAVRHY